MKAWRWVGLGQMKPYKSEFNLCTHWGRVNRKKVELNSSPPYVRYTVFAFHAILVQSERNAVRYAKYKAGNQNETTLLFN
jgi:hypothetical protein